MHTEELYEEGIVKEAKDGIAIISIQDSGKCEECTAKIYCKPGNSEGRNLTVRDPFGVHPGDKVRVSIKGSKILSASFLLYGIPLILLLAGIFIGMEVFKTNKELYSSLLAIGIVTTYALFMFLFSKKERINSYPEIVFVSSPR
ncbi:MAG: SoxR reducing system RseC family protein [Ignavibacteriaceae bacterium]|nr:SoxR reducing system RseC family protein [Ignavibacteriaceae bacterium]